MDGDTMINVAPQAVANISLNVAFANLAAAFNNTGVSAQATPSGANFDGRGDSFRAEDLATAGLTPDATFTHDGLSFTWPNAAIGSPDDVSGSGQAIEISGNGSTLGIIGAASGSDATGPVTVIYTDGTSDTVNATLANFTSNAEPAPGDILATTTEDQTRASTTPPKVSVYATSIAINPAKTVADVVLPSATTESSTAAGAFHVFALAIGTPAG
jgi:beta-glucosidase